MLLEDRLWERKRRRGTSCGLLPLYSCPPGHFIVFAVLPIIRACIPTARDENKNKKKKTASDGRRWENLFSSVWAETSKSAMMIEGVTLRIP